MFRCIFASMASMNFGSKRQTSMASTLWIAFVAASLRSWFSSACVKIATRRAALDALCRRSADGTPMSIHASRMPVGSFTLIGASLASDRPPLLNAMPSS